MNRRAFTLIELILVAAIVAVISGIAIPRYSSSLSNFRARTAARRLVADLALAQSQARASSAKKEIEFTQTGYTIKGIAGLDGKATYTVALSEDPYHARIKLTFNPDSSVLTFDGYGWPDRGGTIQVTSGSSTREITIDGTSGRATVK
jgi:prepilin-type N-terminal cleavage/methylation domain-containing protein